MKKGKWIYVAGPYSGGDVVQNVRKAVSVSVELRDRGLVPICPHLSMFAHYLCPRGYEFWLEWDLTWLERCDALLRLPGDSPGADREIERAVELGLPVYFGVEALIGDMK